jgi:hypothetical protein
MMQPDPMALGPGGGGGQAPGMAGANAGTQMSPSQFGGSTGQQSPGRPQTQGQGQMGGLS